MAVDTTCYRHPDRRAGVSCQRCGRPICPSCMSDASVGFHCPECARGGGQKVYTARTLPGTGSPVVTLGLIAINVAVFVVGLGMGDGSRGGDDQLTLDGGLYGPAVDVSGEWYRIVTAGFLHANLLHLGFNMYLLYLLGTQLEPALGRVRFGLVYVFSLVVGSLGVLLVDPRALTVGASGAVFGLMGLGVVLQRSRGINPFDTGLGGLILINLVLTFVIPGISVGGHVGGLVGGLIGGWVLVELPRRAPALPAAVPPLLVLGLGLLLFGGCLWAAGQWMDPVLG
jgi:membrane associated rhomboid family serine protease